MGASEQSSELEDTTILRELNWNAWEMKLDLSSKGTDSRLSARAKKGG